MCDPFLAVLEPLAPTLTLTTPSHSCGEYIQMSGRAGRRGKDDRGIVIQMVNSAVPPEEAKKILYGGERAVEIATDIIINGYIHY